MKQILLAMLFSLTMISSLQASTFKVMDKVKYQIHDLGTLQSDGSSANCLNDLGQVCGGYSFQGKWVQFIYDPKQGIRLIDLPESAQPTKMNNVGQIIGCYKDKETERERGFFWDPVKGFRDLGTLGGDFTRVVDLNDSGQVVGYSTVGETGYNNGSVYHAFLWQDGVMTDLGLLHGEMGTPGTYSGPTSINNRGEIFGNAKQPVLYKGKIVREDFKAVTWGQDGIQEMFPDFTGQSWVQGIGETSLVQVCKKQNSKNRTYIFDLVSGAEYDLGVFSWGTTMNDTCQYVSGNTVGYIWFAANTCTCTGRDINRMLDQSGSQSKFWDTVSCLSRINNAGCILGSARNIYGEDHAVLLTPVQ